MLKRILPWCMRKQPPVTKKESRNTATYSCSELPPCIPACFWTSLKNGVRVISETTLSPLACCKLFVEGGSRYEIPCNNGATHLIEHIALKGFKDLNRACFEACLNDLGIRMDIHTDREYQVFTASGPNQYVSNMICFLYKIVCGLSYDPVEVHCAKLACLRELVQVERDPKALLFDYLHKTAFQGTTLSQPVIGPSGNYMKMDPCFACEFHDQQFQPFRLVLAVSSVYSHQDIVCMVERDFSKVQETTNKLVYWPCRFSGSAAMFRNDDMPFAHVALAVETGGFGHPDYLKYHLLKHCIGSWDASQCQGYNHESRLLRACDLGKLCVRLEAFYLPYRDVGLFGVYFVVPREWDIQDAVETIQNHFMYMCNCITRNDVCIGIQNCLLALGKNVNGCEKSCHDMGLQMLYYESRRNCLELSATVAMYNEAHVRETMTEIVYDRCPAVAGVGPTESIPEYNRIRSSMHWLRV